MAVKKIKNKILKTELIDWRELKWFQPLGLKVMTESQASKLTLSMENNHFLQPFNVWKKGKKLLILDGHHREMIMRSMEQNGYQFPDLLPANFIDIKSEAEAKKAVLVYNAHYAKMVSGELFDFIDELDYDDLLKEFEIPEIKADIPEYSPSDNEKEYDSDIATDTKCPSCGYEW